MIQWENRIGGEEGRPQKRPVGCNKQNPGAHPARSMMLQTSVTNQGASHPIVGGILAPFVIVRSADEAALVAMVM